MRNFTFIMVLMSCGLHAQTFEWLKTPTVVNSNNTSGLGYSVTTDASGNVFMAGYRENAYNYVDVHGTVAYDKYNAVGDLIWSKTIGGKAIVYDMATDAAGNLLMAAGYLNTISIGDVVLTTVNQGVTFLSLKFDVSGNLLWYYELSPDDPFMNDFRCITTDSAGNVYLGYDDYNSSWITKLSPSGTAVSTITQTHIPRITGLSVDNLGNIYAVGSCANPNATFAGIAAATALPYSTYIVKYSADGHYQWHRYVEDITCSEPKVSIANPDTVYFSSELYGAYTFDNLTAEGPAQGNFNDFFIAKLDGLGVYEWVREVPGIGAAHTGVRNYLTSDTSGNVYFAGSSQGTIDWGNGVSTTSANFQANGLLLKYSSAGIAQDAVTYGGPNHDRSDGIAVTADGIYITGMGYGTVVFGDINYEGGQQYFPYLTKINAASLSVPKSEPTKFLLYPNPASGALYYGGPSQHASIYNLQGQKVVDISIGGGAVADITGLSQGLYVVAFGQERIKLLVEGGGN